MFYYFLQDVDYQRQMNVFHHAFLGWSFLQRSESVMRRTVLDEDDRASSFVARDPSIPFYRSIGCVSKSSIIEVINYKLKKNVTINLVHCVIFKSLNKFPFILVF